MVKLKTKRKIWYKKPPHVKYDFWTTKNPRQIWFVNAKYFIGNSVPWYLLSFISSSSGEIKYLNIPPPLLPSLNKVVVAVKTSVVFHVFTIPLTPPPPPPRPRPRPSPWCRPWLRAAWSVSKIGIVSGWLAWPYTGQGGERLDWLELCWLRETRDAHSTFFDVRGWSEGTTTT